MVIAPIVGLITLTVLSAVWRVADPRISDPLYDTSSAIVVSSGTVIPLAFVGGTVIAILAVIGRYRTGG